MTTRKNFKIKEGVQKVIRKENSKGPRSIQSVRWRLASDRETQQIESALDRALAEWFRQVQAHGGQKDD